MPDSALHTTSRAKDYAMPEKGWGMWGHIQAVEWYTGLFFVVTLAVSMLCLYYAKAENMMLLGGGNAVFILLIAICSIFLVRRSREQMLALMEESRYDALLAGIDVVDTAFFFIAGKEGELLYTDARYRHYFGAAESSAIRTLADFLQKGGMGAEDIAKLEAALRLGVAEQVRFTVKTAEGTPLSLVLYIKTVDIGAVLKYSSSLQKAYMLRKCFGGRQACIVVKAITEAHVKNSRMPFLDSLPVPVCAVAEDGGLAYSNPAFVMQYGEGARWKEEDNSGYIQIHKKNGEGVRVLSQPFWQEEGCSYRLLLPASFRQSNGCESLMLADILESCPVAQVIITEGGDIIESNAAFRLLTGQENSTGVGQKLTQKLVQKLTDSINEKDRAEVKALIAGAVAGEEQRPIDVHLCGEKEGTARFHIKRLVMPYEGKTQLICHIVDTTEQRNLELRFVHSQKMQAVGQLAGGIAHDFNNLLTAMIGFCDLLLLRHPAGDQSFADLMQIKQNTNRAANLVRQLLAFSRKQTLQPEILDITVVLAELSSLVRRLIGENIELKVSHGHDLWLVKVDQGQLDQVMINLAVNARDAMNGCGILAIKTSNIVIEKGQSLSRDLIPPAEDEVIVPGNYVLIEVIDTGTGIPKEMLGKIFEPFFSTKEIGSGTGLGLSTVYGIVKQTGGYIYVTSKEGEGTVFSIFLRGYDKSIKEEQSQQEALEKPVTADLTGNGTILLVEDETPVRLFSSHALTNKGYTVLEASSGDVALNIIEEQGEKINVIITDVIMPGMNGPAMIEQIAEKYPHIRVIFISGYAEDIFIKTYGTERKFNFLPKPFTLKQLASKVKEVMNS